MRVLRAAREPAAPAILLFALVAGAAASGASAALLRVEAAGDGLRAALAAAMPGDRLLLAPGRHLGPFTIDRELTVEGEAGAVLDGGGSGRTVTIDAPGVVLRGLTVTGSGTSLASEDSGVFVTARGVAALIEDSRIEDNLIGVFLKGARDAVVRRNLISGRRDLVVSERGNGVQIWNARAPSSRPTTSASAATASSSSPAATTCSGPTASASCASPSTTCTPSVAR